MAVYNDTTLKRQPQSTTEGLTSNYCMMSTATIVVMGSADVGKTTLVKAFSNDSRHISRIGGNVYQIIQHSELDKCNINIVDTDNSALGKLFNRGNRHHAKHGDAFIIVYSMNDAQSYYAAMETCLEVYKYQGFRDVPVVLVGNKADLKCQVSEYRLPYLKDLSRYYTIAKMGNNVQNVLAQVLADLSSRRNRAWHQRSNLRLNSIGSEDDRHQGRPVSCNYSRLYAALMESTELAVSTAADQERQTESRRQLNMVWVNSGGVEEERTAKGRISVYKGYRHLTAEIMNCAVLETVLE